MKKRVFNFEETFKNSINLSHKINLKEEYSHIRGYHGCRALDLNDYYEHGIVPINKNETLKRALYLLHYDEISEDKIIKVFNSHWVELGDTHKYVWLTLTKKELVDFCGHYLIYGSEFICGIAVELRCHESLRKGIPTIFHCDIPIEKIPPDYLDDLSGRIQAGYGHNFGFKVIGSINRAEIVKCEHPRKIPDPLNNYVTYSYC